MCARRIQTNLLAKRTTKGDSPTNLIEFEIPRWIASNDDPN